jgi:hypothetical protein
MTRRERLERKVERRQAWAESAAERSSAALSSARSMASGIPFGQPILVGHHSEHRDRRYRERIRGKFERGFAENSKAQHHERKAAGLAHQLETSIFSDDEDAIPALERKIAELEQSCVDSKRYNELWKKGGREALAAEAGGDIAAAAAEVMSHGWSWVKAPFNNTSARREIRRCKERIADIRKRQESAELAQKAGGLRIVRTKTALCVWCVLTFAEKPSRQVLAALREAGYRWGQGSWHGHEHKLPACVRELEQEQEQNNAA